MNPNLDPPHGDRPDRSCRPRAIGCAGRPWIAGALAGVLLVVAGRASALDIPPGPDWCAALANVRAGDEAVLEGGDYPGPCEVRHGGLPGAPLVIRARSAAVPPRLTYSGTSGDVLGIYAAHLVLRGLSFAGTQPGIDAIRLFAGSNILIEDSVFDGIGGSAVVANHASLSRVTVRGNRITRTGWTALYFGCHDGLKCRHAQITIERNLIHGVKAAEGDIGAGIQIKLNSTARIRDNVIVDTEGPGIMVYGEDGGVVGSLVERNLTARSAASSGIVVGGGPAIVRNNVAVANAEAGIALENYGRRNLLREIAVAHNSVYANGLGGILIPPTGPVAAQIANNAAHAAPTTPAFPGPRGGVTSVGNVDCRRISCFMRPEAMDFSPLNLGPGKILGQPWMPVDDYFGRRRGMPPVVGAVEQLAGPISLRVKPMPTPAGTAPRVN